MKLKTVRIFSILPIIFLLLTVGFGAAHYTDVHPKLGILSLLFSILTTVSLFLLKE